MRYQSSICAVALAAAVLATPSAAQVVDFGKYPDFKGQWARTGNPNNWHALAGPPPLTPEYQKVLRTTRPCGCLCSPPRRRRLRGRIRTSMPSSPISAVSLMLSKMSRTSG